MSNLQARISAMPDSATLISAQLGVAAAPNSATGKTAKAAQDFEAMFLEQTLERVFSSAGTEGPLGDNGTGGSVYRSMLVKEYAGALTRSGGIGIAGQVYREMLKLQEAAHAG